MNSLVLFLTFYSLQYILGFTVYQALCSFLSFTYFYSEYIYFRFIFLLLFSEKKTLILVLFCLFSGASVWTSDSRTWGWASDCCHPAGEMQAGIWCRQHEQHQVTWKTPCVCVCVCVSVRPSDNTLQFVWRMVGFLWLESICLCEWCEWATQKK